MDTYKTIHQQYEQKRTEMYNRHQQEIRSCSGDRELYRNRRRLHFKELESLRLEYQQKLNELYDQCYIPKE